MNKDIVEGKWTQLKGAIRKTWGDITHDDIGAVRGSAQKLSGVLREKYGHSRAQAEKDVRAFWRSHSKG